MRWSSAFASAALALATVAALVIVSGRLRLDPNVASLLPDQGDAVALRRYVRAVGGGDLGAVMVRGANPELNRRLCGEFAAADGTKTNGCSRVSRASGRMLRASVY
jgi:uncharacterized protein